MAAQATPVDQIVDPAAKQAAVQPSSDAKIRIAWSKDWLDMDQKAACRAWMHVALDEQTEVRLRLLALDRALQLVRISGDFDSFADSVEKLANSTALSRMAQVRLRDFVRRYRTQRSRLEYRRSQLIKRYRQQRAQAKNAAERSRAREGLLAAIRRAAKTAARPFASLLPDTAHNQTRSFASLLGWRSERRINRSLRQDSQKLQSLRRQIAKLRARGETKSKKWTRILSAKTKLAATLRRRASGILRRLLAEIEFCEQSGDEEGVERHVDEVLQLERRFWPNRKNIPVSTSAVEDPVDRRGALLELYSRSLARIKKLASKNPARAATIRAWREDIGKLIKQKRWAAAAARTLEEAQSDPGLFREPK